MIMNFFVLRHVQSAAEDTITELSAQPEAC